MAATGPLMAALEGEEAYRNTVRTDLMYVHRSHPLAAAVEGQGLVLTEFGGDLFGRSHPGRGLAEGQVEVVVLLLPAGGSGGLVEPVSRLNERTQAEQVEDGFDGDL